MQDAGYDLVLKLTEGNLSLTQRRKALSDFARINGWNPSDEIEYRVIDDFSNGHIVVEHGLENTVVISFLKKDRWFQELTPTEQYRLLSISYNNLIEWHIIPSVQGLTVVYNRTSPANVQQISRNERPDAWRAEAFDKIIGKRPNPNVRSLDDALMFTLTSWKRRLGGELTNLVSNEQISALFNAIILARALEDNRRSQSTDPTAYNSRLLVERWEGARPGVTLVKLLKLCIASLGISRVPKWLLDANKLEVFDRLDRPTVNELLRDFYVCRSVPYAYDFSIMSKHALSRIYEHYVSLLRDVPSDQISFFPAFPEEIKDASLGGIYTPQYVARFFSRYLKVYLSLRQFKTLQVVDPACGSGIFPRAILEMQCDPLQDFTLNGASDEALNRFLSVDIDPNACHATMLSLSLLNLVLTGELPKKIRVEQSDAITYFEGRRRLYGSFDVAITNPPFVPWDKLPDAVREQVGTFMGSQGGGKMDLFIAFLKLGMKLVKPGGYLLYVLPQSFMLSSNGRALRSEIANGYNVLFLADLSQIPVFESTGAYVILLILQKRTSLNDPEPRAVCVRCKELVGQALQDGLERRFGSNESYSVFESEQSIFKADQWEILPPQQERLKSKINALFSLNEFLEIRQGLVTGADTVFIRPSLNVPKGESALYRPFLSDREMRRYQVPKSSSSVVFYPYLGTKPVTEDLLRRDFPRTWGYLESKRQELQERASIGNREDLWWRPTRPREPSALFQPKIISPHLVLLPKFSLDVQGKYAVSRCPLLIPRSHAEPELLLYFLGVLNSAVVHWQLASVSHRYSHGYLKLEKLTLEKVRVPSPSQIGPRNMAKIVELTRTLILSPGDSHIQRELDFAVARLYELTEEEMKEIGLVRHTQELHH